MAGSIQDSLERIGRDLGDAVGVGFGSAQAATFAEMAADLRGLGLDGPAQAAERLAAAVGPGGTSVDQLNAFSRLQQMLAAFRVRLARPVDLSEGDAVEVPGLPSLRVKRNAIEARSISSLFDYPVEADPISRYAYLLYAQRTLLAGPVPAEGDRIGLWSNLQAGRLLVESFDRRPDLVYSYADGAFNNRNTATRRNAVRVLARFCLARAPMPTSDRAMRLLEVIFGFRPLIMLEALAVWRQAQGLGMGLEDPYPGIDGNGKTGIAKRVQEIRKLDANSKGFKLGMAWYLNPAEFGQEALELLQGPRGEVVTRLGRTVTLGADKKKRRQALAALCFVEDPLGIPYVREALHDRVVEMRQEALMNLGYQGDEAILPLCRRHLQEKTEMSGAAAIALGALADGRGFPLIWSAYERNIAPIQAVAGLKPLFEACMPMMARIAAAPWMMARQGTLEIFDVVWTSRASAAVLHTVDIAAESRAQRMLLKPFVPSQASDLGKRIGVGLRDLLVQRIGDRAVPLDARTAAVSHLRQIAPDEADALLAPTLKRLPAADVASFGQVRPTRLRFLKKGGKRAG